MFYLFLKQEYILHNRTDNLISSWDYIEFPFKIHTWTCIHTRSVPAIRQYQWKSYPILLCTYQQSRGQSAIKIRVLISWSGSRAVGIGW